LSNIYLFIYLFILENEVLLFQNLFFQDFNSWGIICMQITTFVCCVFVNSNPMVGTINKIFTSWELDSESISTNIKFFKNSFFLFSFLVRHFANYLFCAKHQLLAWYSMLHTQCFFYWDNFHDSHPFFEIMHLIFPKNWATHY